MNKLKAILHQLWCAYIAAEYPSVRTYGYWAWAYNRRGQVQYSNWMTLYYFIVGKRQQASN